MSKPIQIYVDADACPVKNEVYRVAERHGLKVMVVSNSPIALPRDSLVERVVVDGGMDAADNWIAERAAKGDIVVTADVPLAGRCVKAGATVLAPNGKAFDENSIGMTLATRNCCTSCAAPARSPAGRGRFRRVTARHSCRRSILRWSASSARASVRKFDRHRGLARRATRAHIPRMTTSLDNPAGY